MENIQEEKVASMMGGKWGGKEDIRRPAKLTGGSKESPE